MLEIDDPELGLDEDPPVSELDSPVLEPESPLVLELSDTVLEPDELEP